MRAPSAAFVALLLASRALAQNPTPGSGVFLGAGVELTGIRDNTTFTPGISFQGGFVVVPHHSPLSLRAELGFFNRSRTFSFGSSRSQVASVNLGLAYRLGRRATQPYLIGGFGLNRLYLGNTSWFPANTVGGLPLATSSSQTLTSGSLLAGVGVQRHVLGLWLFSEARYSLLTHGQGFARHILPLTVGLRF